MAMRKWSNGAKGSTVKDIIDLNFEILSKHLSQNMLALSTSEIRALEQDYLSVGLRCYDTTLNKWFVYDGTQWQEWKQYYSRQLFAQEWVDNSITIPYSVHLIENPIVQLFVRSDTLYIPVQGGVDVDDSFNIVLSTDLPFDGKVVVK